jgi:hypothetical protein
MEIRKPLRPSAAKGRTPRALQAGWLIALEAPEPGGNRALHLGAGFASRRFNVLSARSRATIIPHEGSATGADDDGMPSDPMCPGYESGSPAVRRRARNGKGHIPMRQAV